MDLGSTPRVRVVEGPEQVALWHGKRGGGVLLCGSDHLEQFESWYWKMAPTQEHTSEAHPIGTAEFLYVISGSLTLKIGTECFVIGKGSGGMFAGY